MRIVQLLSVISFGDAVSNDARAIAGILTENGFENEIYAEHVDNRLPRGTAHALDGGLHLSPEDLLIYHASTGTQLNFDLPSFGGRQVMIYHNITPREFFHGYNTEAEQNMRYGYEGVRFLADKMRYCIADSDYNRQQLRQMGYTCPIDVCPILIPFEDYDREPDQKVLKRYQGDGYTNLLFVGRVSPNKKHEDIIRAFYCYQKRHNPKSRLILAGNAGGMELYADRLRAYAQTLGVADRVIFPGHIKFDAILACYRLADVFVCMSEHEGFCVPLLEAMHFGVPIVAYRAAAVPETLGAGGLLLDSKDPWIAAAAIDRLARDQALRAQILEAQKKRLADFSYAAVRGQLLRCIETLKSL